MLLGDKFTTMTVETNELLSSNNRLRMETFKREGGEGGRLRGTRIFHGGTTLASKLFWNDRIGSMINTTRNATF